MKTTAIVKEKYVVGDGIINVPAGTQIDIVSFNPMLQMVIGSFRVEKECDILVRFPYQALQDFSIANCIIFVKQEEYEHLKTGRYGAVEIDSIAGFEFPVLHIWSVDIEDAQFSSWISEPLSESIEGLFERTQTDALFAVEPKYRKLTQEALDWIGKERGQQYLDDNYVQINEQVERVRYDFDRVIVRTALDEITIPVEIYERMPFSSTKG